MAITRQEGQYPQPHCRVVFPTPTRVRFMQLPEEFRRKCGVSEERPEGVIHPDGKISIGNAGRIDIRKECLRVKVIPS